MNLGNAPSPTVLRGLHIDRAPLRLGRAAVPSPATRSALGVAEEERAAEDALQQAHALARSHGHEEGLRSGREQGLREGRQQADQEIRQAVQDALAQSERERNEDRERLRRIVQHAQCALADLLWSAQEHMVALCYETLCRMVGAAAAQPEFIQRQLSHLMAQHGAPGVVLHVHPQDAALLQRTWVDAPALRVIPDPRVAAGGCILQCSSGALDARLETMLASCKAALLEAGADALHGPRPQEDA